MPHPPANIYLGLGTNLGDRYQNLRRAVKALADFAIVRQISPLYQTEPWGVADQPAFLNLCLHAETNLPPLDLLTRLKQAESALGRQQTYRWGPRLIDIDILFYDNLILQTDHLTVPHPHLAERVFVLAPLADIAPELRHPQTDLTVQAMLSHLSIDGASKLVESLFDTEQSEK